MELDYLSTYRDSVVLNGNVLLGLLQGPAYQDLNTRAAGNLHVHDANGLYLLIGEDLG